MAHELSYVKNPLLKVPEVETFTDILRHWSDTKPTEEAFVFLSDDGDRDAVTWRELYNRSIEYAKALITLGVQEGEVVGITLRNCKQWLFIAFGAIFARAIPMGIEIMFTDGSDILAILKKVEVCSTFILDTADDRTTWNIFRKFLSTYSKDGKITSEIIQSLRYLLSTAEEGRSPGHLTIDELLRLSRKDIELPMPKPEDVVALYQTSGTTGVPKVVAHSHKSYTLYPRESFIKELYQPNSKVYCEDPFGWIEGCPLLSSAVGNTMVLRNGGVSGTQDHPRFVINAIKQERCTMMIILPSVLRSITAIIEEEEPLRKTPLIHTIWSGGQPVNNKMANCVHTVCNVFVNGYGSTETLDVLTKVVQNGSSFENYNCGNVVEGYEVKIVNDAGDVVPVGTRGLLHVRGHTMFSGYFNDPEKTRAVLSEDGWYKTDDIGYMTDDGEVFVEGRKSDTIISGALCINPANLESVLLALPDVEDGVFVPIPDADLFQVICACIVLKAGSDVTEATLRKHLQEMHAERIQQYTQTILPKYYLFFEQFPKTSYGKTDRNRLKDIACKKIQSK